MSVVSLGGAREIGASATLINIAGARILIDSGVRTSSSGRGDPLPDWSLLRGKPVDAMIVTHAHADHTGALPIALPYINDAPVHMTTGTLHLLEVLQLDALRRISSEEGAEETFEGVHYTVDDVGNLISRVVPHGYYERFCPVPGRSDIQAMLVPCGHILGAASLILETEDKCILWLGDYSISPQPTVGGLDIARLKEALGGRRVDLMVSEGTYGDSVHPNREREEERLIATLEKATSKGGNVLIPAFAVGRAQDIGVLIRKAKLAGRLKGVSVYLDGMVRGVTSIYQSLCHELYPDIEEPLEIFDAENQIFRANSQSRAKLQGLQNEGPAIVIASSGMLIGGQSVAYAKAFAPKQKNAILITGYSDEESPSYSLVRLKRGGILRFSDGDKVRVRAFVGRYHLSAHADAAQIREVVEAIDPRRLALVHGTPSSLRKLSKTITGRKVVILQNGRPLNIRKSKKKHTLPQIDSVADPHLSRYMEVVAQNGGSERMPSATTIRNLWVALSNDNAKSFSEHEMCRMLLGHAYTPDEREEVSRILRDHRLYFMTGMATGQRSYTPRPEDEVRELIVEQSNAYQISVQRGDVVVYCDGSTDQFVALVEDARGKDEIEAVISQTSRRTFRREWLRCVAILGDEPGADGVEPQRLLTGHKGLCLRWLDELAHEARDVHVSPVELYYHAIELPDSSISLEQALAATFSEKERYSKVERLAVALTLSGSSTFFSLLFDGRFRARSREELARRWKWFAEAEYVRSLPPGASVLLADGQKVIPTGSWDHQAFGAKGKDGSVFRCSYRRVKMS